MLALSGCAFPAGWTSSKTSGGSAPAIPLGKRKKVETPKKITLAAIGVDNPATKADLEVKFIQTSINGKISYGLFIENGCSFLFKLSPEIGSRFPAGVHPDVREKLVTKYSKAIDCIIPESVEGSADEKKSDTIDTIQERKKFQCQSNPRKDGESGVTMRNFITRYTCPAGANTCNACRSTTCEESVCQTVSKRHAFVENFLSSYLVHMLKNEKLIQANKNP